MKCYTIEFGGGETEINAESERDAMEKFRAWIFNAPGIVWMDWFHCTKVEEIES